MQTTVANKDLLEHLIQSYYCNGIKDPESMFISSHWRNLHELLTIETDKKGNLVKLSAKGTGIETYDREGYIDKLFDFASICSHLIHLPNREELLKLCMVAFKLCNKMGLNFTLDIFRQVCSLEILKRNLSERIHSSHINILMIGDGYGVLSAMFKSIFPNSTIFMIDIRKVLLFQAHYCQKAHPKYSHELLTSVTNINCADFVYCPIESLDILEKYKFDIATNIVSMHEMNFRTIQRYFNFLRKCLNPDNLFYCCNREFKILMEGEVTHFLYYPWQANDKILVDGFCPWHQYYFSKHTAEKGLSLFGIRIPWVNFYERINYGKIVHKLVILETNNS